MAYLARAAMNNETLVRIASTRSVSIDGRTMTNHNKLLTMQNGFLGLKTGYTRAAGRTLVSCAQQNGQRLIAVTLQDGNDWADHQALYDYGFSTYPATQGAVLGQALRRARVTDGAASTVPLVAADSFSWPLAAEEELICTVALSGELTAPVAPEHRPDRRFFSVGRQEVGRVDLLCGADVIRGGICHGAIEDRLPE